MLVTERPGRLRIVGTDGHAVRSRSPACRRCSRSGQGGLLDVALDPEVRHEPARLPLLRRAGRGRRAAPRSRAAKLGGDGLEDVQVIFRQEPKVERAATTSARASCSRATARCSSRWATAASASSAQDLADHARQDRAHQPRRHASRRTIRSSAAPARGRRSGPTATATCRARRSIRRPAQLWTVEHGARGGDEVNHPQAGQELRLAGHHLRRRLLRHQDRRGHGEGGHGAAGLLLGPVDRAVGRDLLHRRQVPGMEGHLFVGALRPERAACASMLDGGESTREERFLGELASASATCAGPGRLPLPAHRRG